MKKSILGLLLLSLMFLSANLEMANAANTKGITFSKVVNGDVTQEDLSGKVVMIEIWGFK